MAGLTDSQANRCNRYLNRVLTMIPTAQQSMDSSHASIVYFCVLGLKALGFPAPPLTEYLSALYLKNGFRMSTNYLQSEPHLPATYFCLAMRAMDPQATENLKIDVVGLVSFVDRCQHESGSFKATPTSMETSMRHIYSAFAACTLLNTLPTNYKRAVNYILQCQSMDGGFGDKPNDESHAGLTFCALASLKMAGCLHLANKRVVSFLAKRQTAEGGHNGRPNKDTDVCYSFWNTASCEILGIALCDREKERIREYLVGKPFDTFLGGFSKVPNSQADPYHTALALGTLSILKHQFNPVLSIPKAGGMQCS